MPIPTEYRDLVRTLVAKTKEGAVKWRADKFDISVVIDNSKFSIWAGKDEHTNRQFVAFALHDTSGHVIDAWSVDASDSDFSEMHQLHQAANRQALGVPVRLKDLEKFISQMKAVGVTDDD